MCKQEKTATTEFFTKLTRAKDGLNQECKSCTNRRTAIRKEKYGAKDPNYKPAVNAKGSREHTVEDNKTCTRCGLSLPATLDYFHQSKQTWDNLCVECKSCIKNRAKKYRELNKDILREKDRIYKLNNKERAYQVQVEYFLNNKEKLNSNRRIYLRDKRKNDIKVSLNDRVRTYMSRSLTASKRGLALDKILGYTIGDLKTHLESLFSDGMSWDNRSNWHIDHIKPISAFKYTSIDDKEFKACWKLNNLRPLWAKENILKKDSWSPKQEYKNGDIQLALTL